MFRNVLIPLDGSEVSTKVLDFLEPILHEEDTSVVVLHVADRDPEAERPAVPDALRALPSYRSIERRGDPAAEILAAAHEEGASLIAMSTHGRTGLSRLVRGSVAERVLRQADVPVLLVNPFARPHLEGSPIHHILVPLDGSANASAVLDHVEQIVRLYGSRVTLLHVAPPGSHESIKGERRELARETAFRDAAAEHVRRLEEAGAETDIDVVFAFGAAGEILSAVQHLGIDLVALTTHGKSGLTRWLFGSVAEHVIRECRAPMLVKRVTPPEGGTGS